MKHLFLVACGVLGLWSCSKEYPERMPDIKLTDAYGNKQSASALTREGEPAVVSFYATWCDPCVKELNELKVKAAEWKRDKGLNIIMVAVDKYPVQVSAVLQTVKHNEWNNFNVLFDTEDSLMHKLHVETVPTTYFIDDKGNVRHKTTGYQGRSVEIVDSLINVSGKK